MSLASPERVAVVVLLVVGGLVSCGDDESQETTGPYAVGVRSVTFVDDSRGTPAFGAAPAQPTRTVVTDLWYPAQGDPAAAVAADPPAAEGPFPLVVFNHGQQGEPQQYAPSFETWARAGYVVAAPRHPISVRNGPGGQFVHDIEGELGDVPFVIDSIDEELSDLVDVDHLAVGGHSSGALVAFAVAFDPCCDDDRVDAVLVEAMPTAPLDGDAASERDDTPALFMHGDADLAPLAVAHGVFDAAEPPKYFLSLAGGDHSDAYRSGPSASLVATTALAFFDRYLKDRDDASETLETTPGIEAAE